MCSVAPQAAPSPALRGSADQRSDTEFWRGSFLLESARKLSVFRKVQAVSFLARGGLSFSRGSLLFHRSLLFPLPWVFQALDGLSLCCKGSLMPSGVGSAPYPPILPYHPCGSLSHSITQDHVALCDAASPGCKVLRARDLGSVPMCTPIIVAQSLFLLIWVSP